MRKILSLALAVLMLCSLCTTGFAATINETGGQSANTTVTYGVEMSYIVTVPDSVVIDAEELTGSATVTASNVMLSAGYQLNVTLNSDFTLTDASNTNNTLGYTVKNNGVTVASGDVVLFVESGDTDGASTILALNLNSEPTKAGAYSDVMTFGVSVSTNLPAQPTVSGIWVLNNNPTNGGLFSEDVNFTANGENFTYMSIDAIALRYSGNRAYNVTVDQWTNENYKIVDFGTAAQTVSQEFYDWLTANATQQVAHTVSGVWVFNETITQPSDTTWNYPVNFSSEYFEESIACTGFRFELEYKEFGSPFLCYIVGANTYTGVYDFSTSSWLFGDETRTVDFGATEQTVSADFYTWLTANATKQETSLISFTINGTSYQAEDGMTWEQWADSSYNTGYWSVASGTIWDSRNAVTYNSVKVAPTDVIIEAAYGVVSQGAGAD